MDLLHRNCNYAWINNLATINISYYIIVNVIVTIFHTTVYFGNILRLIIDIYKILTNFMHLSFVTNCIINKTHQ